MQSKDSSAALWVVALGALVSIPILVLACVAADWKPVRALVHGLILSAPYLGVLWCLASRTPRGRALGVALALVSAVLALLVIFLVTPSTLREDVGRLGVTALWLFPVTQLVVLIAAWWARRSFPPVANGNRSLILLSCLGYFVALAVVFMPSFERPPSSYNDSLAASQVRTVQSYQWAHEGASGHFGTLACLASPSECGFDILPLPPEMAGGIREIAENEVRRGYRFTLHGVPVPGMEGALSAFAYTGVPLDTSSFPGWRRTGVRSYCGDSTGRICVVEDGSTPPVKDGRCGNPCRDVQ